MLCDKEIRVINERIKGTKAVVPASLFKYRPFDEFTCDMLENEYLYLCPAERLDDPSECKVSFDINDYFDIHTNQLTRRCVSQIVESIRPYTNKDNFSKVQSIVESLQTSDGLVKRNWLLDASFELQQLLPDVDIAPLVNMLGNTPEKINDVSVRTQIERLFKNAMFARKEYGICSLTIEKNSAEMWKRYAAEGAGYCVEYDLSNYAYSDLLFPVVYTDQRENNILMNIVGDFIGQMIIGITNGQIDADRSKYLRMFLTKDTKWKYQNEWRLIGVAGQKIKAPPIKSIYVGKAALVENVNKLKQLSCNIINCCCE